MSNASNSYHTISNAECSGVFCHQIYDAYSYRDNDNFNIYNMVHRIGIMGDYHLFIRCRDKVYIEVREVGEIVISFAELQKNKYWKYYYDLSLLLANNKHIVIHNSSFNNLYDEIYEDEYTEERKWSLDTAFIDLDIDPYKSTYKIIPSGNVCYYKINPFEVENMEYATPHHIDIFKRMYMRRNDVRYSYFLHRSVIYKNIAIEYQVNVMEKELEELLEFFEDKKIVINLAVIQEKHTINSDVLMILYNNLLSTKGNKKYAENITEIETCKNKLEIIAKIIDA